MKLVWCPETAGKVYIDAVKLLSSSSSDKRPPADPSSDPDTDVAELIAAMAGGWKAQCILEAWVRAEDDCSVATSLALSAAARLTGGRHVCVVPDERSRFEYSEAMSEAGAAEMEIIVGEAEGALAGIQGVDFAVVDCRRRDARRLLRAVRPGQRGAVIVCMEADGEGSDGGGGGGRWRGLLKEGTRVVRSALLPIGRGVEILHVGVGKGPSLGDRRRSRWIKHVDRETGEEHVFRR